MKDTFCKLKMQEGSEKVEGGKWRVKNNKNCWGKKICEKYLCKSDEKILSCKFPVRNTNCLKIILLIF